MKALGKLYHFLGGIYFTLVLIACVAAFVIAGTFIESATESHRYAAYFTYGNPLFALLLWGFFVNILFSATRRWPFQVKHIPFLITHFGLLMILSGTMIKSSFGQQGTISLLEGGATDEIFEMDTYVVQVEKHRDRSIKQYEVKSKPFSGFQDVIADEPDGLQLKLLQYAPHCVERWAAWIKGPWATIDGLPPMPVHEIADISKDIPISGMVRFHGKDSPAWDVYALRVEDTDAAVKRLSSTDSVREPWLALLEDKQGDVTLFARDPHGQMCSQSFRSDNLKSFLAYDDGFGGYAIQAELSFTSPAKERQQIDQGMTDAIASRLKKAIEERQELPAPLERFRQACDKAHVDFIDTFIALLAEWDQEQAWFPDAVESPKITLETSLVAVGKPIPPKNKLEDNIPLITLKACQGGQSQVVNLSYDRHISGLKWPILKGTYALRFQPKFTALPYRIRLRQARQINYANSSQPFSYEADLIITDKRTREGVEKTISMNHVHETWDGYRFYLANIAPPGETAVKRVQIVVNHDPAKYWLTYPGAIIMTIGIVLLFTLRPYKPKSGA